MVSGTIETEIRNDPANGEWVSRADYMERTGTQERTLTKWIKDGVVKSRIIDVEENGKLKKRRQVFLPNKITLPEKSPEPFRQSAGNDTGSHTVDPEANFRTQPRLAVIDPELSRSAHCLNCERLQSQYDRLQGQVDLLRQQLHESEVARAELKGEMKGKDDLLAERQKVVDQKEETIKSKEQAINAANGMVLLYEKQVNPALETDSSAVPENEKVPETDRQHPVKSSGWRWPWGK